MITQETFIMKVFFFVQMRGFKWGENAEFLLFYLFYSRIYNNFNFFLAKNILQNDENTVKKLGKSSTSKKKYLGVATGENLIRCEENTDKFFKNFMEKFRTVKNKCFGKIDSFIIDFLKRVEIF